MHQLVDGTAESARIRQERGDVAKQDTLLRVVRDGADGGFQVKIKGHWSQPYYLLPVIARSGNPCFRCGEMDCFASLAVTAFNSHPVGTHSRRYAKPLRRRATSWTPDEMIRRRP